MNKEFYNECLQHFNEPILSLGELVRCIGYAEDESDCYLLYRGTYPDTKVKWHSMCGGYTFLNRLKGQNYTKLESGEGCDDLTRLDSHLELNGCPKEEVFNFVNKR